MFNEKQKEGFARVLDTLAASAIIGISVDIFGYAQSGLEYNQKWMLIFAALLSLLIACYIRE